jgi:hypothetical protein
VWRGTCYIYKITENDTDADTGTDTSYRKTHTHLPPCTFCFLPFTSHKYNCMKWPVAMNVQTGEWITPVHCNAISWSDARCLTAISHAHAAERSAKDAAISARRATLAWPKARHVDVAISSAAHHAIAAAHHARRVVADVEWSVKWSVRTAILVNAVRVAKQQQELMPWL